MGSFPQIRSEMQLMSYVHVSGPNQKFSAVLTRACMHTSVCPLVDATVLAEKCNLQPPICGYQNAKLISLTTEIDLSRFPIPIFTTEPSNVNQYQSNFCEL